MRLRAVLLRCALACVLSALATLAQALTAPAIAQAEPRTEQLPTGKSITPTAAPGSVLDDLNPKLPQAPDIHLTGAAAVAVSPDGTRLAILTSGFNKFFDPHGATSPALQSDYLLIYNISAARPLQLQALPLRATWLGLSWAPSSNAIFVSGGVDDLVQEFIRRTPKGAGDTFAPGRTFKLSHKSWVGPRIDLWDDPDGNRCVGCTGEVSGLSVSPDGTHLLVANMLNDSVSLIDLASAQILAEQDLRPGIIDARQRGRPGGSYPRAIAWTSQRQAFIASERDREIIRLAVGPHGMLVTARVPVKGQPTALVTNRAGSRLYVALDTTNTIAVIDTKTNKVVELLDATAPAAVYTNGHHLGGANTNALALTPDETILLVSNGGENAIAVVRLGDTARDPTRKRRPSERNDDSDDQPATKSEVIGLVPTGWYPTGVAASKDGKTWYVVNAKAPTGPNAGWCYHTDPTTGRCHSDNPGIDPRKHVNDYDVMLTENQQIEQLETAGLLSLPTPSPTELARLTKIVATNNRMATPDLTAAEKKLFDFLHQHIHHVLYIMKENRSYDQILGDLEVGNGDPRLTLFPNRITPNHHKLARNFVTLDNTLVSGEGSLQGYQWTMSAQTTDHNERNEPLTYVGRGAWDAYGNNRTLNMGYATNAERARELPISPADPDILPGTGDVIAPDGPYATAGKGYIWDAALAKGLTVRNWGFAPDATWMFGLFDKRKPVAYEVREPFKEKTRVFWTSNPSLRPNSDPYYRTFFFGYPDFWREREWEREFAGFCANHQAPALMLMWLGNDHMGHFDVALDGVNTPETQVADNDYALGRIVAAVAKSPFANDTLIISIEDDAWDGADHVDSHRTIALFAGAFVRQHAVISTRYTTVNVVKTIEEILGIGPISLNDAFATPMSDVFDPNTTHWSYDELVPDILRTTKLPLTPSDQASYDKPAHPAAYWTKATAGQDFSGPDRVNPLTFTRILWHGLKGDTPYPATAPRKPGHR